MCCWGWSSVSFWHQTLREGDGEERPGLVVSMLSSPFRQGHVEELWGLATHPSRAQFVTCGQDKLVHLWSAESHQPLWSRIIEVRGWGPDTSSYLAHLAQCVRISASTESAPSLFIFWSPKSAVYNKLPQSIFFFFLGKK